MVKSREQGGKGMRISGFILLAAAAAALHAGCGTGNGLREPGGMPGGFTRAGAGDAMVMEAAEFAAAEISRETGRENILLKKIISAEQQVVAGMNYRLALLLEAGDETKEVDVLVWRKLSGYHELVSWSPRSR